MLLKDIYLKKSEAEEQLEEQKEVTKSLEDEIIHLSSSTESKLRSAVESLEEELEKIRNERDQLREEIRSFNDKLEMAYGLADENEAIAVEARQACIIAVELVLLCPYDNCSLIQIRINFFLKYFRSQRQVKYMLNRRKRRSKF
jgi:chromosome segregation ATPase